MPVKNILINKGSRILQTRPRQQSFLEQLSRQSLENTDLNELLEYTFNLILEIMNVDYCVFFEYFQADERMDLRIDKGWGEEMAVDPRIRVAIETLARYTLRMNQPVIIENFQSETGFSEAEILRNYGIESGLSIIVPGRIAPFGVFILFTREAFSFSLDDSIFFQGVGSLLASAILRLRTESALRLSRDQLSVILEGVADGIIVLDSDRQLVFANQAAARLLGFDSKEELFRIPLEKVLLKFDLLNEFGESFPLDQLPNRLALQGVPNPSAVIHFKTRASDEGHWSLVKARPIMDLEGRVVMAVSVFHDISKLKQSEHSQIFLAEAGKILSSSLDYSATLKSVADLAVTNLADWCIIDVLEDDDFLTR